MTFEPYAVQCTTCASRLRVTDPAVVGTIVNCPKCNSMVEISSPRMQQQVAVGSPQIDSEAITEDAIAAEAANGVDPNEVPSGFGGQIPPQSGDALGDGSLGDAPLSGPLPPTWQSERTQRSRQVALVIALAGSGLVASMLLFGWFVKNWPTRGETETQPIADVSLDTPSDAPSDAPSDVTPNKTADTVTKADATTDAISDTNDATDSLESSTAPPTIDPTSTPSGQDTLAASPTADGKLPASVPSDLMPDSMLDPLGLNTPAKDTSFPAEPAPAAPGGDGPMDLPPEARIMAGILNLEGGLDAPNLAAPATMDELRIEGPTNENIDPMMIANPPEPINFRKALATKLALNPTKNDEYPLSDLMLLMSQLSGVPIQIDWVSFDILGTKIRDGVPQLKGNGWENIDQILARVAASVGGKITRDETMVTLEPTDEVFSARVAELINTSDFGTGEPTAIATINAFLVGAGQPGANAKQIKVGQERQDQQVAVFAVEAMRRIRGVAGKIDDQILNRWAQSATDNRLDWPLVDGGTTGSPLLSPLTMAGFLRRISRENDSTCFVNWYDANRRGMAPQQLVMPFMENDAGKVLKTTLSPFELQVRRVDRSHWWVGTEATYDRFPVIVWTDSLGQGREKFVRRIDQLGLNDEIKLAIDPDTNKALMLIPRYIVRQLPQLTDGLN